ncbi:hypothetical protein LG326_12330 [Metaplanococcus flavidus]
MTRRAGSPESGKRKIRMSDHPDFLWNKVRKMVLIAVVFVGFVGFSLFACEKHPFVFGSGVLIRDVDSRRRLEFPVFGHTVRCK